MKISQVSQSWLTLTVHSRLGYAAYTFVETDTAVTENLKY